MAKTETKHDDKQGKHRSLETVIRQWKETRGSEYQKSFRSKVKAAVAYLTNEIERETGKIYCDTTEDERGAALEKITEAIRVNTHREKKRKIYIRAVYDYAKKKQ